MIGEKKAFRVTMLFPDLTRKRAYPLPVPLAIEATSEAEAIKAAISKAKRFFGVLPILSTVKAETA